MSSPSEIPRVEEGSNVHASPMEAVRSFFLGLSHADALRFCLGLGRVDKSDFPNAPQLAFRTTVVCFDTESWCADSNRLTEIGFNRFCIQDTRSIEPGPWGQNFFHNSSFYHARIAENSHLRNTQRGTRTTDPPRNRVGLTRFLSSEEARNAQKEFYGIRATDTQDICPVIILGHAVKGDIAKMLNTVRFDPNRLGNIVRGIDTQQIVRDLYFWTGPNQIGLRTLVQSLGLEYRDAHTASNDAAMTLMVAVLLVLPDNGHSTERTIQDVFDDIEQNSQTDTWDYGSDQYCSRCHSRQHSARNGGRNGGNCRAPVHCSHCESAGRSRNAIEGHMTEDCVSYGLENGNSRTAREKKEANRRRSSGGVNQSTRNRNTGRTTPPEMVFWDLMFSNPRPAPHGPNSGFQSAVRARNESPNGLLPPGMLRLPLQRLSQPSVTEPSQTPALGSNSVPAEAPLDDPTPAVSNTDDDETIHTVDMPPYPSPQANEEKHVPETGHSEREGNTRTSWSQMLKGRRRT